MVSARSRTRARRLVKHMRTARLRQRTAHLRKRRCPARWGHHRCLFLASFPHERHHAADRPSRWWHGTPPYEPFRIEHGSDRIIGYIDGRELRAGEWDQRLGPTPAPWLRPVDVPPMPERRTVADTLLDWIRRVTP